MQRSLISLALILLKQTRRITNLLKSFAPYKTFYNNSSSIKADITSIGENIITSIKDVNVVVDLVVIIAIKDIPSKVINSKGMLVLYLPP